VKIAVLGTGAVGRALAARLAGLGHEVALGTRDVERTLTRTEPDGSPSFAQWHREHENITILPFAAAGAFAELLLNATAGANSLAALDAVGAANLAGKTVLDLAIPLDLSQGLPPTLTTANDDSLGEQIQRAFPETRVVKSLHTVYFEVMIDPGRIPGQHSIFVAGDDDDAKQEVVSILRQFGWPTDSIIDLGDITTARATEMYSRLFFDLHAQLGTFDFNIALVRA
jgi:predicted dinucleotide-binding enzyme